jgi:formylglycine-generating enzyme required for sulfatase activity
VCITLAAALPLAGQPSSTGRKYALLVGVRIYNKDELKNLKYTENDVNDLADILLKNNYQVKVLTYTAGNEDFNLMPTAQNIRTHLKAIMDGRKEGDTILLAFSGHGIQFKADRQHYFCPSDTRLGDPKTLISLTDLYKDLEKCQAGTKLLLIDACRDDPEAELAKFGVSPLKDNRPQTVRPPGGVAALFSCSEGQQSYESDEVKHGVFFHFIIEGLKGKAANRDQITLLDLVNYTQQEVPDYVKNKVSARVRQNPNLVGDLNQQVVLVQGKINTDVKLEKEFTNKLKMKMVLIKEGKFVMGAPREEEHFEKEQGPQHEVTISRPFYMAAHPVTVGQFRQFVAEEGYKEGRGWGYNPTTKKFAGGTSYTWENPGWEQTADHPVVNVSYDDAVAFCKWLSKKERKTYTLPTEAQWEYACRAGTTTCFFFGNNSRDLKSAANIGDASLRAMLDSDLASEISFQEWDDGWPFTSPVGTFKPNAWGLYDMHGNVWQWCRDYYDKYSVEPTTDPAGPETGKQRILRGGSWNSQPRDCRSAFRYPVVTDCREKDAGFRVVMLP